MDKLKHDYLVQNVVTMCTSVEDASHDWWLEMLNHKTLTRMTGFTESIVRDRDRMSEINRWNARRNRVGKKRRT